MKRPFPSAPMLLDAPIDRWDEAIPLGNGIMGTLLWGGGHTLKLSLDRGDMWDLRPTPRFQKPDFKWATVKKWVKEKKQDRIVEMIDDPYNDPYPTKIPAGRLELTLDKKVDVGEFSLDLRAAVGSAVWSGGRVDVFCSAEKRVGLVLVKGSQAKLKITPIAFGGGKKKKDADSLRTGDVSVLGYPAPKLGATKSRGISLSFVHQKGVDGFSFAIVIAEKKTKGESLFAYAVTTSGESADPVALGQQRVLEAIEQGHEKMRAEHVAWWSKFWNESSVSIPDDLEMQQHYELAQYFYGSASRRGAPPIPLQGVWTADEGKLPPWRGDYHHDLNTQLTYWAYPAAGHFNEGLCFLDYLWSLKTYGEKFAREFYEVDGMLLPGVAALDGQPLGGWAQYTIVPSNTVWLAHSFYMHWRYTMDRTFLAERAFPWCEGVAKAITAMLETGKDGKLHLPLSTSPEIHDNTHRAWLKPETNYDLALLRWFFAAMSEMAGALQNEKDAKQYSSVLKKLDDYHVSKDDSVLMLDREQRLEVSHRHMSHLMAIHPLGTMHVEQTQRERNIIRASLDQLVRFGSAWWVGYSFAWASCLASRAGMGDRARTMLYEYLDGCVSRNGFHLNGDYKRKGYACWDYRPFTLEGNFAAAQAVHEMLLQSWGKVVRLFPAMPSSWNVASFESLRAEGGFVVSATYLFGKTVRLKITATVDQTLRLRNPFKNSKPKWSVRRVKREGDDFVVTLRAGESVEAIA